MKTKNIVGVITFILSTIIFVLFFRYCAPEPEEPTQGIHHNYYYPDEDIMWITKQNDTIWE